MPFTFYVKRGANEFGVADADVDQENMIISLIETGEVVTTPLKEIISVTLQSEAVTVSGVSERWHFFASPNDPNAESACSQWTNLLEFSIPVTDQERLLLIDQLNDRDEQDNPNAITQEGARNMLQSFNIKPENPFQILEELEASVGICYYEETGKVCYEQLAKVAPDHPNLKTKAFSCNKDNNVANQLEGLNLLIAILSKDSLQIPSFVQTVKSALNLGIKIAIIHDPLSCGFPGTPDQPEEIRNAFTEIAIRFVAQYAETCWSKALGRLKQKVSKVESVSTVAFLSHKQTTGQGIALALYQTLKYNFKYKVFIDVQAEFDLHDLDRVVSETLVFIFIVTPGIFESFWCLQEFHTAVRNKKKILIVRDLNYSMPNPLPGEWLQYSKIFKDQITFVYDPIYLDAISRKLFSEISSVIEKTELQVLKHLGLTDEDALNGKFLKYEGTWIGEEGTDVFSFQLNLSENLRFKHLNTEKKKFLTGSLAWTFLETQSEHAFDRLGHTSYEFLEGTYDMERRVVRVMGVGLDSSGRGHLAVDRYVFQLSKEGFAIKGLSLGNDEGWDNPLVGTTEAGRYMVHTW